MDFYQKQEMLRKKRAKKDKVDSKAASIRKNALKSKERNIFKKMENFFKELNI